MINKINILKHFFIALALVFATANVKANDANETLAGASAHETNPVHEPFDAGKTILEHVADAHDWHLWGHTSIPLPIILKTDKGFDVFLSNKFEHGHAIVKGKYNYKLEEGAIVIVDDAGIINEEATGTILDLSITKNVTAMLISMVLMLWIFISIANTYKKNPGKAPKGLQSFMEPIILFVRDDVAKPSIGKKYERFMPYLLTVFFFIAINNYMGLIPLFPGGVNLTGSISVAMVLAAFSLVITFFAANKHYWQHVFAMPGVPIPVLIILTPIEIIGLFLRPFVLMVRLFANITAGHIIVLAFFSLIFIFGEMNAGLGWGVSILSLVFTVFMGAMELLVAFLQAYVFALLSAIYFGAAVDEGHDVHNHVDDHKAAIANH